MLDVAIMYAARSEKDCAVVKGDTALTTVQFLTLKQPAICDQHLILNVVLKLKLKGAVLEDVKTKLKRSVLEDLRSNDILCCM